MDTLLAERHGPRTHREQPLQSQDDYHALPVAVRQGHSKTHQEHPQTLDYYAPPAVYVRRATAASGASTGATDAKHGAGQKRVAHCTAALMEQLKALHPKRRINASFTNL